MLLVSCDEVMNESVSEHGHILTCTFKEQLAKECDSFHLNLNESVVWGCFYVFFFALEQGGRRQYLVTFF